MRRSVVALFVILATVPATTQSPNNRRQTKTAPTASNSPSPRRTPDGYPDLQGIWTNNTLTPLERPRGFEEKAFFMEAEEVAFEKQVRDDLRAALGEENTKTSGDIGFDAAERGNLWANRRTALIVDPANGKFPLRTPDAQGRLRASTEYKTQRLADGPEYFTDHERCLTWNLPPMLPPPSNTQIQIVLTHDHVLIFTEMFGEARVIPLN